jgi:glycerophosphoryl diester phosphodiesterase
MAFLLALAPVVLAAPAPAAGNPWLAKRPLNIAHQGGEDEFPSNTLYAFKRALRAGADMLELDIGVTKDDQVVVMHDTTVDRVTNGHGTVASKTLRQIQALDGSYWFSPKGEHYGHDHPRSAYAFRGVATGKRRPPKGFSRMDFRVPTLREVLRAFPKTPINIEIKGRTKQETDDEYVRNAEVLAKLLKGVKRRDLVVTSFHQKAVDRFHELVGGMSLAPGIDGAAAFLLSNKSPGDGVETFDLPITYELGGTTLQVGTRDNIARAHQGGYAWHSWFGNSDADAPSSWGKLLDWCADGVMTSRPVAFERFLRSHRPPASCT